MTFSAVIRCGRDWTPGDPCRQAEPVGVIHDFAVGRALAARAGWTTVVDGDRLVDRCPACTRRELEGSTRRRATDRQPVADVALPAPAPAIAPDYFDARGRGHWLADRRRPAADRVGRPLPPGRTR